MKLYILIEAITQDDHIPFLITDSKERAEELAKKRYVYYEEFILNEKKDIEF